METNIEYAKKQLEDATGLVWTAREDRLYSPAIPFTQANIARLASHVHHIDAMLDIKQHKGKKNKLFYPLSIHHVKEGAESTHLETTIKAENVAVFVERLAKVQPARMQMDKLKIFITDPSTPPMSQEDAMAMGKIYSPPGKGR